MVVDSYHIQFVTVCLRFSRKLSVSLPCLVPFASYYSSKAELLQDLCTPCARRQDDDLLLLYGYLKETMS